MYKLFIKPESVTLKLTWVSNLFLKLITGFVVILKKCDIFEESKAVIAAALILFDPSYILDISSWKFVFFNL